MELHPCPRCRRHVVIATSCPFCGDELERCEPRARLLGRLSRAMVFASATLATTAACGGKQKKADDREIQREEERSNFRDHPCAVNTAEVERLEKAKAEAKTDDEKQEIERQLDEARIPVCAPYGAPPARRRVV